MEMEQWFLCILVLYIVPVYVGFRHQGFFSRFFSTLNMNIIKPFTEGFQLFPDDMHKMNAKRHVKFALKNGILQLLLFLSLEMDCILMDEWLIS